MVASVEVVKAVVVRAVAADLGAAAAGRESQLGSWVDSMVAVEKVVAGKEADPRAVAGTAAASLAAVETVEEA